MTPDKRQLPTPSVGWKPSGMQTMNAVLGPSSHSAHQKVEAAVDAAEVVTPVLYRKLGHGIPEQPTMGTYFRDSPSSGNTTAAGKSGLSVTDHFPNRVTGGSAPVEQVGEHT